MTLKKMSVTVVIGFLSGGCGALSAASMPSGCTLFNTGDIQCPLSAGTLDVTLTPANGATGASLVLQNQSTNYFQLQTVHADYPTTNVRWSEVCVQLGVPGTNDFMSPPGQRNFARGEVECTVKPNGIVSLPDIAWDNGWQTGLAVPPGYQIMVGQNWGANPAPIHIVATVLANRSSLLSLRQPLIDPGSISCNDGTQYSAAMPMINTTNHPWHVSGIRTYAANGADSGTVAGACAAVWGPSGNVKTNICEGLNTVKTSLVSFDVAPGDTLQARAFNNCPSGGAWNWSSYFFMAY